MIAPVAAFSPTHGGALALGEIRAAIETANQADDTQALAPLCISFEREMTAVEENLDGT